MENPVTRSCWLSRGFLNNIFYRVGKQGARERESPQWPGLGLVSVGTWCDIDKETVCCVVLVWHWVSRQGQQYR